MKGLAGNQTRGIITGSVLDVVDNTGAKTIAVIAVPNYHGVHGRCPAAAVGDIVIASVKKGTPEMRRQVVYAIIVRQRRPFRRADGTMVHFEDNAAVITTEEGETKGSDIKGPVAREAAERWPRVAATASTIV
ncbi:MAG TPA: 50S ribosomal protein L14 [Methanomassiliicoccales archaeon]|jgi:large subunit ribosomal protein L14|nr:50S ribosomal protein L14 [Methanomassiliicoccales archaeon]